MMQRVEAVGGLLVLSVLLAPGHALAGPGATDSATARISLVIPARVEVREDRRQTRAFCANVDGGTLLEVRTRSGEALPACGRQGAAPIRVTAGERTVVVTPL